MRRRAADGEHCLKIEAESKDQPAESIEDCLQRFVAWPDKLAETSYLDESFIGGTLGARKVYFNGEIFTFARCVSFGSVWWAVKISTRHSPMTSSYVLITPARNEGKFIEGTIKSVVSQTIAPRKWVIVNDGSTDDTAEIVRWYADRYSWIELRESNIDHTGRVYSAKAQAVNAAYESLKDMDFDIVANLDADVSFDPDYFEFISDKLLQHPEIGVIGTPQLQPNYDPVTDGFFNEKDVFGACQIFRRECFEQIGGYLPLWGGVDWAAVRMARMCGWTTRIFLEKPFRHNRIMGATETNRLVARFKYGVKDYYLGNHPVWQLFRITFQLTRKPYVVGGAFLLLGYSWGFVSRMRRDIPEDLLRFHRSEEMERLSAAFIRIWPWSNSSA